MKALTTSQAKDARKFNPFACQFSGMKAANLLASQGYIDAKGSQVMPAEIHELNGNVSIEWPDGSILRLN